MWTHGKGNFTSKFFSKLYESQPRLPGTSSGDWNQIWSSKFPLKIRIFLWKLNLGILPTRKFLSVRISNLSLKCVWCDSYEETIDHIFWRCEIARWAWSFIGNWCCMKPLEYSLSAFSLNDLFNLHPRNLIGKIWRIVIAASL